MSFLKEQIEKIKIKKDAKIEYYNAVKYHLNKLKNDIVSLLDNPKEHIIEIMQKVADYDENAMYLFENATYYNCNQDEEERERRLGADEIKSYSINLDKERVIENLTGYSLKLKELHTNHVLLNRTVNYTGQDDYSEFGLVHFFAFCDDSVDTNKFYTVNEINELIKEEKMIVSSGLSFDCQNSKSLIDHDPTEEYILDNLEEINYPVEDKDRVEIIFYRGDLTNANNEINFKINLNNVLMFSKSQTFQKDLVLKEIKNINNHYSGIESIICSSVVHEISKMLTIIEKEKENAKIVCKNSVKQLLIDIENDLKEINETELNN